MSKREKPLRRRTLMAATRLSAATRRADGHRILYIGYESHREDRGPVTGTAMTVEREAGVSGARRRQWWQRTLAIDRKTPVAFTNVLPAQIQEELAGRDLPLDPELNAQASTPRSKAEAMEMRG